MEGYIGQILMFGGNFAPRNWALCDGQLLSISQNSDLFSILGVTYGGDGRTTFALPDLRGRAPVHAGHGPGLSSRSLGQKSGSEDNTLTENQMPAHNHQVTATAKCLAAGGNSDTPVGNVLAKDAAGAAVTYSTSAPDQSMDASTIEVQQQTKGANQSINNMQPFLAVNYIICTDGLYPSRN